MPVADEHDRDPDSGSTEVSESAVERDTVSIPRWRQIEIMRERKALRELLDDLDDLDADWDEEIFGSQAEREAYYKAAGEDLDEEEEVSMDDDDVIDEYEDD